MTDGTFFRTVTIDEPDFGAAVVTFALVSSVAIADNQEIFPRREYAVTLDADGLGSITLPCADDTGARAWLWSVTLNGTQFFVMAYGASISLAELLVTSAATEDPASLTALLNAKMDKQPTADTGTVVLYDVNGNSALSGIPAGAVTNDGVAFGAGAEADQGGGAIGRNALATAGGAIGDGAASYGTGGAIGRNASVNEGAAIGGNTITSSGVAVGFNAKTIDGVGNSIDAIQLGTGTNTTVGTLQVYGNQLLDASGNIPAARMTANLGSAAVLDAGTTGADLVEAETVDDARAVLGLEALATPAKIADAAQYTFQSVDVVGSATGIITVAAYHDLNSGATANSQVRRNVNGILMLNSGRSFNWPGRLVFSHWLVPVTANAEGILRLIYGKQIASAYGLAANDYYVAATIENATITTGHVCNNGAVANVALTPTVITTSGLGLTIISSNGAVSWYAGGVLIGSTSSGPTGAHIGGTINYELQNGATAAGYRMRFSGQLSGY